MDSKEFWETFEGVVICKKTLTNEWFTVEDLYQAFAERFRRENVAERSYSKWEGDYGEWFTETADIVEKSDEA